MAQKECTCSNSQVKCYATRLWQLRAAAATPQGIPQNSHDYRKTTSAELAQDQADTAEANADLLHCLGLVLQVDDQLDNEQEEVAQLDDVAQLQQQQQRVIWARTSDEVVTSFTLEASKAAKSLSRQHRCKAAH